MSSDAAKAWSPENDERLVRFMAMVTPLGYASARAVVDSMTILLRTELNSQAAHARVWQQGFDAVTENAHVDWVVNSVPINPYEPDPHEFDTGCTEDCPDDCMADHRGEQ